MEQAAACFHALTCKIRQTLRLRIIIKDYWHRFFERNDMEKKQSIYLLIISVVLALVIYFLDERTYSFAGLYSGKTGFMLNFNELFALMMLASLMAVLPLCIYFGCRTKRFGRQAFPIAMLGFVPSFWMILPNVF